MSKVRVIGKSLGIGLVSLTFAAVAPLMAGAASSNGSTTINATIAEVISISTPPTVAISITPSAGGSVSSASDAVTVSTNNATGYRLMLADGDTNTALVSGSNTIPAHSAVQATPSALANNTWGYRVVGQAGFGGTAYSAETNNTSSTSTWAGVPSSAAPVQLRTVATPVTSNVTTVWYGVKVTTSQASGVYTDTVSYTAITN